ncbi:hypothetical protein SLEP1_g1928 [Rubroshorea leprosula]|uniref:Glycosyl transferase 64 domain-containing protein n=1 Tax=Rubroshorea leprosula TaxID=152421 RepID=A0AAV5HJV4_9ROSI|nr:hypothetical protein SLEP1_g1928 [Rubroshorea leprosula]
MRRIVNEKNNCEDILMNFIMANKTNAGPVMVAVERVRDWGDARNDEDGGGDGRRRLKSKVREVGLSSRRAEHRKRRGGEIAYESSTECWEGYR